MEAINRKKLIDIENELLRLEKYKNVDEIFNSKSIAINNTITKLRNLKNKILFEETLKQELNKTK